MTKKRDLNSLSENYQEIVMLIVTNHHKTGFIISSKTKLKFTNLTPPKGFARWTPLGVAPPWTPLLGALPLDLLWFKASTLNNIVF